MIPLVEKEMTSRGWIPEDEVGDIIVLSQSAPGILAVNMAVFAGYRLRGFAGSLAAAAGAVLPSLAIILAIAMAFTGFRDNEWVIRIFSGIRPVAVALILVPALNLAKRSCTNWWTLLLCVLTMFLVAFLKVSPLWIILVIIVCASAVSSFRHSKEGGR